MYCVHACVGVCFDYYCGRLLYTCVCVCIYVSLGGVCLGSSLGWTGLGGEGRGGAGRECWPGLGLCGPGPTHYLTTGRAVRTLVFAVPGATVPPGVPAPPPLPPCLAPRPRTPVLNDLTACPSPYNMVTSCELDLQPQQQRHHHDYNASTEAAVKDHAAVLGMMIHPECECLCVPSSSVVRWRGAPLGAAAPPVLRTSGLEGPA